jgi:TP901 family phage tail tape measure protein
MSDGSDTLYTYTGDASSVMESLDEIMSGLDALLQKIQEVADAASQLASLEEALAGVAESLSGMGSAAMDASTEVEAVTTASEAASEALTTLGSAGEDLSTIGADAGEAATQIEGLNSLIDELGGTIAEDTAIIGGLNEQITNLEGQLQALTATEGEATAADAALGTAKGETAVKAQTLGDALKNAQGPLLMLAGAGIMAGKSFLDMGTSAQDSLNQVQSLAGVAPQAMGQYTSQLEEQANEFGESLDQEGQGLFYVTSAGFQNSAAMRVLAQSVEDAKAGHIDLGVAANGLTTVLNAYGASADQATAYNDIMVTAVTQGKQTFQDFATSIAKAAVEGNAAHISFNQVAAAEAALTDQGLSARQSSMDLASMMKAMDANADATADTATKMGLSFDEASYKTMDLQHQMQYLQQITSGNQTELSKLTGGSAGLQAFNALMTVSSDGTTKFSQTLDSMQHSSGAASQAFQTSENTISAHMDHLNASLSVISFKAITAITPLINAVADAVGHATDFMSSHTDILMPILAGLAAVIGTALAGALVAFVIAAFPVLAVLAAVGTVVGGVVYAYNHWGEIVRQANTWMHDHQTVMALLIGGITGLAVALAAAFVPAMVAAAASAVAGFGAWAVAAAGAAAASLIAAAPFILIGVVVAAVVAGIILAIQHWSEITKFLQGVWAAFSSWFMGALDAIGAFFVSVWNGIVTGLKAAWDFIIQVVKIGIEILLVIIFGPILAIAALFILLYQHNRYFQMLIDAIVSIVKAGIAWLQNAWQTAIAWLVGAWQNTVGFATTLWNMVANAIYVAFSATISFVASVWNDISSFFVNAWDNYIVGPLTSLWNNVSNVFSNAWSTYIAGPIASLWNTISTTVAGWAGKAVSWGENLINSFVTGIENKVGSIGSALGDTASKIANFLGFHSPTVEGEGRYADQWPVNFMNMFIAGIESKQTALKQTMQDTAQILAKNLNPALSGQITASISALAPNPASLPTAPPGQGLTGGNGQIVALLAQILAAQQRQQVTPPTSNTLGATTQQYNTNTFNGVQDIQSLYNALNALQGLQNEYAGRGAIFNY